MYDIPLMVKSISDAFMGVFDFLKTKVENAPFSEVILEKHRQEKAIYHAKKAIEIMRDYIKLLPKRKQVKLRHHINGFNKYD